MRIVCLITVGSFFLSTAISGGEVPVGNNVQRVPRALLLQPVVKVNEEDDGPFDFISNWLSRMISPKKIIPQQRVPQMLGPIRVPGLDDQVFIKQIEPTSNVIIRVRTRDRQMPMTMTYYPMNVPTRQAPMMSSGFAPIPAPTWSRPLPSAPQPQYSTGTSNNIAPYRNDYFNNQNDFRNRPGYSNNFRPQPNYHHRPHYQAQAFRPTLDPSVPQNGYRTYDYHNSISGTNRGNYGGDSLRNYQGSYSSFREARQEDSDEQEEKPTASSEELTEQREAESFDLPPIASTAVSVSSSDNEIIRTDRMVPTNPTRVSNAVSNRLSTTSTTAEPSDGDNGQLVDAGDSPKRQRKYSRKGIQVIPAPDLKAWKESMEQADEPENHDKKDDKILKTRDTNSWMDDDGIMMEDGTTLGKGESQEHVEKENGMKLRSIDVRKKLIPPRRNKSGSRKWKPISTIRTTEATIKEKISMKKQSEKLNLDPDSKKPKNSTRDENATPDVIQKVMNLTAGHSWRPQEAKKTKKKQENSKNRRVRVVESVRSSVSMTSSKGTIKSKAKT